MMVHCVTAATRDGRMDCRQGLRLVWGLDLGRSHTAQRRDTRGGNVGRSTAVRDDAMRHLPVPRMLPQ